MRRLEGVQNVSWDVGVEIEEPDEGSSFRFSEEEDAAWAKAAQDLKELVARIKEVLKNSHSVLGEAVK